MTVAVSLVMFQMVSDVAVARGRFRKERGRMNGEADNKNDKLCIGSDDNVS